MPEALDPDPLLFWRDDSGPVMDRDQALVHLTAADPRTTGLLVLSGVVTALPLIWFASAAKRLAFSTLGIIQYLSPTLSFLLAVGVYGEPFTLVRAFAFACIWVAVGLYSVDLLRVR